MVSLEIGVEFEEFDAAVEKLDVSTRKFLLQLLRERGLHHLRHIFLCESVPANGTDAAHIVVRLSPNIGELLAAARRAA
jgi:hypothetical protein